MADQENKHLAVTEALKKLEVLIKDNKVQRFTDEEAEALENLAKLLLAFKSLGTLGGAMYRVAMWTIAFFGVWFAMRNGMADFVREVVAGK